MSSPAYNRDARKRAWRARAAEADRAGIIRPAPVPLPVAEDIAPRYDAELTRAALATWPTMPTWPDSNLRVFRCGGTGFDIHGLPVHVTMIARYLDPRATTVMRLHLRGERAAAFLAALGCGR